jgi:hypothetical protein
LPLAKAERSWNHGKAKQSITEFVAKVTQEGSPDFVPVAERIATFDNYGTLWAEQPMYFQVFFALDRVKAFAPQHPRVEAQGTLCLATQGCAAGGDRALTEIVAHTQGLTSAEFEKLVKDWTATAKHPVTKRLYTETAYQPMLKLMAYLRANGFRHSSFPAAVTSSCAPLRSRSMASRPSKSSAAAAV